MEDQKTLNKDKVSESFELTQEEKEKVIAAAIKQATNEKAAKVREKLYWDKVYAEKKEMTKLNTDQYKKMITRKAKELIPGFELDKYREGIFNLLCQYFTGNELFEDAGYSLKKGIMLYGNVGCGKTTMMTLFRENQLMSYIVISARQIAGKYMDGGYPEIEKYNGIICSFPNKFGHQEYALCIDDLGTESDKKHFGNNINVIQEIILNRYDNRNLNGKTHLTTNLTGDQIENEYGLRVRSRMREMFNIIAFDNEAGDLRK